MLYVFDIPVYRLREEEYELECKDSVFFQTLKNNEDFYEDNPAFKAQAEESLRKGFGGNWKYNEIIGYIRLHVLGTQIRGEYYVSSARKHVKTRRKIFEFSTHKIAPEVELPATLNNQEIFELILYYVNECKKEFAKIKSSKRRYIDSSLLEAIGPYVDWRNLIFDHQKKEPI